METSGRMQDSTVETIEELPWGPGRVRLVKPLALVVETSEDAKADKIVILNEELNLWGAGETFDEALLDFAANFESVWDELSAARNLHYSAIRLVSRMSEYLPDDV